MGRAIFILVLSLMTQPVPMSQGVVPLLQAHAHNDYLLNTDDLKGLQEFLLQHGR